MDVARLNMSHGTREEHAEVYRLIREASDATGHGVGIFADLQGPKIRLGEFEDGKETIEPGDPFTITTRDILGDATICGTTYDGLPGDVNPGDDDPDRRRQGAAARRPSRGQGRAHRA